MFLKLVGVIKLYGMNTFKSDLSKKEFPVSEKVCGSIIRQSIFELIQKDKPDFSEEMCISISELNKYREKYIEQFLVKESGQLTEMDKIVLGSLKGKTTLTDKIEDEESQPATFGQKIADKVAVFGGSWAFIIFFGFFLFLWILTNVYWLASKPFDPYPFILLNLILSTLAALQAPVIMMSQNRQEDKDRERGKRDYMVNLKSELEIRMLHEKIDHLVINQQQEVIEIHKMQIEMLNDILSRFKK